MNIFAQSVDDIEKINEAVDTTNISTQDIVIAVVIIVAAFPISKLVVHIIEKVVNKAIVKSGATPHEHALKTALNGLRWLIILSAAAWSAAIVGVDIGWLSLIIVVLGILFVLMVRPLIENTAAGLLLQTRPSFSVGDEIETHEHKGEVLEINARSTVLRTRDWRRIHIPNTDILSDPIVVYTAFNRRRSEIELEIEYSNDIDNVSKIVVSAAKKSKGVHKSPAPSTRATGYGSNTFKLKLRWWHNGHLSGDGRTLDSVVRNVKKDLEAANIAMPSTEIVITENK